MLNEDTVATSPYLCYDIVIHFASVAVAEIVLVARELSLCLVVYYLVM